MQVINLQLIWRRFADLFPDNTNNRDWKKMNDKNFSGNKGTSRIYQIS